MLAQGASAPKRANSLAARRRNRGARSKLLLRLNGEVCGAIRLSVPFCHGYYL